MDPVGPAQPSLNTVYDHPANPAQSSFEHAASKSEVASQSRSAEITQRRTAADHDPDSTPTMPTSLAYGERTSKHDAGEVMGSAVSNTEGEQMRAAGEGDIARRQEHKEGFGEQEDLAADLDRKKEEQAQLKAQDGQSTSRGPGSSSSGQVDVGAAMGGGTFVGA